MENTTSKKNIKASTANPNSGNPPPGDKTFGLEPKIRLYELKDSDNTEEG